MNKSALRTFLVSTVFAGLASVPALSADVVAPPDDGLLFAGLVELAIGFQDMSVDEPFDSNDSSELTFSGAAHMNIPLGDAFSAQLSLQSEFYDRDDDDQDEATDAHALGGHLSWRDPNSGLFGVFGGAAIASNNVPNLDADGVGYIVGVEGQIYLDNITLYAQAGYGDIKTDVDGDNDEGFLDAWFGRAVGRYFFTENTLIQAEVAYGETDEWEDADRGVFWNWGLKGKMRVAESIPLYATAEYRGGLYESHDSDDGTGEEHVFLAGLGFMFGTTSLWENDRRGATLDLPMLPSRAAAWTEAAD